MRDALFSCGLAVRLIGRRRLRSKLIEMLSIYSALLMVDLVFRPPVEACFDGILISGLLLVVRVLKREVRAFGGCLGMHRR